MATVLLQTAGAALGGAIGGPVGATIGRAVGSVAGGFIDQKLFGSSKDNVVEGPRLEASRVLTSTEGAPMSKVYGRARISGEIIWATRLEEVVTQETTSTAPARSSGKGIGGSSQASTTTTQTYTYFGNFAVGICEGPISAIRRIWADAEELDLTKITFRTYLGGSTQNADPLIEAKQGLGNTPAYRHTAYVVFEGLPLEKYGNRIPQVSFEVVRPIGRLENQIKTMTVIPGATEYGYDTTLIESGGGTDAYKTHNRHGSIDITDWKMSIDELQALCPNLQTIALVATWYGNDLRAANCDIRPGVTTYFSADWSVAGYTRGQAHLVSQINGRAAYGGTPTDESILRVIADIKQRGLKVVFYPFIMMDIPPGNGLPWNNGTIGQPVHPWRGRISCFPAPGIPGSVDKTSAARAQLDSFSARYKVMIRHYANLCAQAGGVHGFLLGSELRELTRVRDQNGNFPFVETLSELAGNARAALGSNCRITYAADWTEYFGYQPADGSGDVLFNLDPLWASPNIDTVGIDNYMPLADWRGEGDPHRSDVFSPYDADYLASNVAAEEGYDWYYASESDRLNGSRTPITDGQGEPWVFRYKDIVSWWSNSHYNRIGGVRHSSPTPWQPKSKPIWITELGCPAVDKGANQPNVFFDPKSDQSALPYFSSAGRDDLIQRRFLEAHYDHWSKVENNPVSPIYGGRMLEPEWIAPWAWDARPFPWFPLNLETWSDGDNWHLGHWMNGRLGGCALQDLVQKILRDFNHFGFDVMLDGIMDGYVIPSATSARQALEPLMGLFDFKVWEEGGKLVMRHTAYAPRASLELGSLVQEEDNAKISARRVSESELPGEAVIQHASVFSEFENRGTKSRRLEGGSDRQITFQAPVVIPEQYARDLADARLRSAWRGRETRTIALATAHIGLSAGDVVNLPPDSEQKWQVESIESGLEQQLELSAIGVFPPTQQARSAESGRPALAILFGRPEVLLMDLPHLEGNPLDANLVHVAASAAPWGRSYAIYSSPGDAGFALRGTVTRAATLGTLAAPLAPGPIGIWDRSNSLLVELQSGQFESLERNLVLNGANAVAVQSSDGGFELVQFERAELVGDRTWRLESLLRGQLGSDAEMRFGSATGAKVVLLNGSILPVGLSSSERGLVQNWRVGVASEPVSSQNHSALSHTHTGRNRALLSPVHLSRKMNADGSFGFSWIRRGRLDADSWEGAEIPLDTSGERYLVEVRTLQNTLVRTLNVQEPGFDYTSAERQQDLGDAVAPFKLSVAQVGDDGLPGKRAEKTFN